MLSPTSEAGADVETGAGPEVVDLHVDLSYRVTFGGAEFAKGSGQYQARHLRESGVYGVVLPLFIPHDVSPRGPRLEDLEASYRTMMEAIPRTPPYAAPGCRAEPGQVRTWFAFEGAGPLAEAPESVDTWVRRGVRLFGLVHNHDNALASSSATRPAPTFGLTKAGRSVTHRVFSNGAAIDVSHASDRAISEIFDIAEEVGGVVVATHSNARALADHPRNLTDEQLARIAGTRGVVGVNFHARFLVGNRKASATLADVVRHVRHLVKVAGMDHVALGSDFEGGIRPPKELADVRGYRRLAEQLRVEGFDDASLRKIFSRNALRVLCPEAPARSSP
jgi:membrane dipeptidase